MGLLDSMLKVGARGRRARPYLPFTEPSYRFGRRHFPQSHLSAWRDTFVISNVLSPSRRSLSTLPMLFTSGADRRRWNPQRKSFPAVDVYGQQVSPTDVTIDPDVWRRIHKPLHKIDWRPKHLEQIKNAPWWYGFANPRKTVICVKRKIRREIMHAFGLTGQKGQNPPRYNEYSRVRC